MAQKHLTVKIPEGLHFRALAKIFRITREQQCSVLFQKENGEKANSDSFFEMLALCAITGTKLQVTVDGQNANKTMTMIEDVFENGAGI
ncbi:MAG: HPr family phosphocarrier protein [Chlorobium sp.]|nr:MAG: HPr family phosphocarrier protein [Chlorobium sp.]